MLDGASFYPKFFAMRKRSKAIDATYSEIKEKFSESLLGKNMLKLV